MTKYKWEQPSGGIWKVETDIIKGTIKVYNENGGIISNRNNLSKEVIDLIEKNFFDVVATKIETNFIDFDPMVA